MNPDGEPLPGAGTEGEIAGGVVLSESTLVPGLGVPPPGGIADGEFDVDGEGDPGNRCVTMLEASGFSNAIENVVFTSGGGKITTSNVPLRASPRMSNRHEFRSAASTPLTNAMSQEVSGRALHAPASAGFHELLAGHASNTAPCPLLRATVRTRARISSPREAR